jgi:hypothetical protein
VLREDVVAADLGLLVEQLAAVRVDDATRTDELRSRYLSVLLDALRTPPAHHPPVIVSSVQHRPDMAGSAPSR